MTKKENYISSLDSQKQDQVDKLIGLYAVSCSIGYDDIIVPRESFVAFISGLTSIGVVIISVNWWCYATEEKKSKYGCPHGFSGPKTRIGLFSGLFNDLDEIDEIEKQLFNSLWDNFNLDTIEELNKIALNIIQEKRIIIYPNRQQLNFKDNPCLTPGFDLHVPENWKWKDTVGSTN